MWFRQRDRQNSAMETNDVFSRHPVTSAQVIIGAEKPPDAGIVLNYNHDAFSQGSDLIKEAFEALTKDDILKSSLLDHDFEPSIKGDVGYNLKVFHTKSQKKFTASQPIIVEFKIDGVVPYDKKCICYGFN